MGLFNKTTEEQKLALAEIDSYRDKTFLKFRLITPRYGLTKAGYSEGKFFNKIIKTIKKEINNDGLTVDQVESRVHELLAEKYGEPMSQEEADQLLKDAKELPKIQKEQKLEQKFGIQFHDRVWFKCTIEEKRHSTFSNTEYRDVVDGYVFVEDSYLEIIKESVFIKSKMGNRKVFYENIASLDYDTRGKLHASGNLEIYLKSSERIQLKFIDSAMVELINSRFEEYMDKKISGNNVPSDNGGNVDDLLKIAELYEKGLLTKEEFEIKKKELFNNESNTENGDVVNVDSDMAEVDLSPANFCINCGHNLGPDNKFCPKCGTRIK